MEFLWTLLDTFLHVFWLNICFPASFEETITLKLSRVYSQEKKGGKFQSKFWEIPLGGILLLTFDSWNWPLKMRQKLQESKLDSLDLSQQSDQRSDTFYFSSSVPQVQEGLNQQSIPVDKSRQYQNGIFWLAENRTQSSWVCQRDCYHWVMLP